MMMRKKREWRRARDGGLWLLGYVAYYLKGRVMRRRLKEHGDDQGVGCGESWPP